MNEANNQARLLEQLVALASRAAYVCAHDYEAHKPVGTRLIAIADLKAEYDQSAQLLKEIQESGGRAPDAAKTPGESTLASATGSGETVIESSGEVDGCDATAQTISVKISTRPSGVRLGDVCWLKWQRHPLPHNE